MIVIPGLPRPLFTGTVGGEGRKEGKGSDCPGGSGLQEVLEGRRKGQAGGWAVSTPSMVPRVYSGLRFTKAIPLVQI